MCLIARYTCDNQNIWSIINKYFYLLTSDTTIIKYIDLVIDWLGVPARTMRGSPCCIKGTFKCWFTQCKLNKTRDTFTL